MPAYGLYDVDAFAQQVQSDGIGKLGQHLLYIFNGSGSAFFVDFFAQ